MRIRRWQIPFAFLVLCGLVEMSWGSAVQQSVLIPQKDPATQREFQNVYQCITNPTISSATIRSATISSATVTGRLTVPNGVNPTDAAAFGQIVTSSITFTDWVAYTPTVGGVGSFTTIKFFWRQIGNTIFVKGYFLISGSLTATNFGISVPSGAISSTKAAANVMMGSGGRLIAGANAQYQPMLGWYDGSDTSQIFFTIDSNSGAFAKLGGSSVFNIGDGFAADFSYPL